MKWILILLLITACSTASYEELDSYKDPNLEYDWAFNSSMETGGHTYNRSYFELKKYNLKDRIIGIEIPYEINFKHEEGHIYHHQFIGFDNFDSYYAYNDDFSEYDEMCHRQYILTVSEGYADYYVINYFNNTLSSDYIEYLEENKEEYVEKPIHQHWYGYLFVNKTIADGIYNSTDELLADFGTVHQYELYNELFPNTLKCQSSENT